MSEHAPAPQRKRPQSFSELFPGRFLHADHLKGKKVTLTIADAYLEELEGEKGKAEKPIVAFEKTPLLLVLAKINGTAFKAMFGADVRKWAGRRVTLYPTDEFLPFRKGEACIRVWGSPDITSEFDVPFQAKKRKTVMMRMHVVADKSSSTAKAPPPAAPPLRDVAEHDDEPPYDEDDGMGGRQ